MKVKTQQKIEVPSNIKPENLAFNVWLNLLDELVDKKVPFSNAMVLAGNRLQEKQREFNNKMFNSVDLYLATESINILLRRRPEYQQRTAGWAKRGEF